mmetsp:Transcript_10509/g.19618  ORF Transcript_10509/g.19618 Transcript_10509/m.19618 type:complete len:210 (-) Transcript_10509:124-753(-)
MIRNLLGAKGIHSCMNAIQKCQKRSINQCLHIKGLPIVLSKDEIYAFMKDYGTIQELASYDEAPQFMSTYAMEEADAVKRKNFITHDRPPGQTAIIRFHDIKSAIMCKEELHWRPFPSDNYQLTDHVIQTNPRDRPLVNALFETEELFQRLRPWVKRDLHDSRIWIAKVEGRPIEAGLDRGRILKKKKISKVIARRMNNNKTSQDVCKW